ncbi:MAG: sucrose-6-phosphate hydrolase [Fusobacterium sp.]|nr:sucrose-6-phosphate hydrolase [Fusobacterium sp.]
MWRNKFHINPKKGLLNDPNGLIFFKGEYHIFYQYNPNSCEHKNKHWAHLKSKNLVDWEELPIALSPTDWFDKDGCYSGSAIEKDNKLYLIYTGNVKSNDIRESYQCLAVSEDGVNFKKLGSVISNKEIPNQYTKHFRDPKVWFNGKNYSLVLGAQRSNLTGTVVEYISNDLINWHFKGELLKENFGYMCECPDKVFFNKDEALLFCPQGLEAKEFLYNNLFQSGYIINDDEKNFCELDRGFEFYAPQTFKDKNGDNILIGWVGMPENTNLPSVNEGWIHNLTIPRKLILKEKKIFQIPHQNLKLLRKESIFLNDISINNKINLKNYNIFGKTYELIIDFKNLKDDFSIEIKSDIINKTFLNYDYFNKIFSLSRDSLNQKRSIRKCKLKSLFKIHIFSDNSCLEIFLNDGEEVFTANIFSTGENIILESKNNNIFNIEFYKI